MLVFGAALALRLLALFGSAGYTADLDEFARWAQGLASAGPFGYYAAGYGSNYPAFLWVLWPISGFGGEVTRLLIKGISIPFDLALGALLFVAIRRAVGPRAGLLAAALYLLDPPTIVAGPLWGQVDAVGTLPLLAALLALAARRHGTAGALAMVALLVKPQFAIGAWIVLAAAAIELVRRRDAWPALRAGIGAAIAFALVCAPLRLTPGEYLVIERNTAQAWQQTTLFALNPWWIVTGPRSDEGLFGIGVALLALGLVGAALPLLRGRDLDAVLAAGLLASLAFYFLPTRVHERYLFPALALAAPLAVLSARTLAAYAVMSAAFLVSLVYAMWYITTTTISLPPALATTLFSRDGIRGTAVVLTASAIALAAFVAGPLPRPRVAIRRLLERGRRLPRPSTRKLALAALVIVPTLFQAIKLLPELTLPLPSVNDDNNHYLFIQRASEALANGENPFDHWVPQMELGFPEFFYYQHLPHLAVVALHRLLLGTVDLLTLFNSVRYLLMVGFPITVFLSMRYMGFRAEAAAFGSAVSSLFSAAFLFGFEYESYVWLGFGVYTQLWAMHLGVVALAALWRLLESGRGYGLAIAAMIALALSHLAYTYMTAITALVLVGFATSRRDAGVRAVRLGIVAAVAIAASAYFLLPFVLQRQYLNVSPLLPDFRLDSFGAPTILGWLVRGELFDRGRLPVITLLAAAGIAVAALTRARLAMLGVALFVVWLVLYFGRATLGPVMDLFPFHEGLPAHRFLAEVDLAAILLCGVAAAWLWDRAIRLRHRAVPLAMALVLVGVLVPAFRERGAVLDSNATLMERTKAALDRDTDARAILAEIARRPPGRVYAGLRTNWGERMLNLALPFPSLRFYDLLTFYGLPSVAPPYYSWSLNADLEFSFDERSAAQYDTFNVRYVVAPATLAPMPFWRPAAASGPYQLYEVATGGYAGFVGITERRGAPTQRELYERNTEWLARSDARHVIRWDFPAAASAAVVTGEPCANGAVLGDRVEPARLAFTARCTAAAVVEIKTTYHPDWVVSVDGASTPTFMVSPSYLAFELPAGEHRVVAEYRSFPLKAPLLLLGLAALVATIALRRRLPRLEGRIAARLRLEQQHDEREDDQRPADDEDGRLEHEDERGGDRAEADEEKEQRQHPA